MSTDDASVGDFTAQYLDCGLKLSERDLLRSRFIMAAASVPSGQRRLSARENFLAELLADPDKAAASRSFFPSILGLPSATQATCQPGLPPWVWPDMAKPGPRLETPGQLDGESLNLLEDFSARVAALMAGAAIGGAARLEEKYLYTQSWDGRSIQLTDDDNFSQTQAAINIPRRADRVWVLGFVRSPEIMGLNPGLARLRPLKPWLDWAGQIAAVQKLTERLQAGGYLAYPSAGGLVLADHCGALAGLGELGRQGLLISPEYGPNLRLFTIITDYPLIPDRPVTFGVADYCETCQRCINECPAKALTEGRRHPGLYQWPVQRRACFDNWLEKQDPCRKCIEVCPYTREPLVGSPGGAYRPQPS